MAALGAHQTLVVTAEGAKMFVWGKTKRGRVTLEDSVCVQVESTSTSRPTWKVFI
jgi:hypothetical protein